MLLFTFSIKAQTDIESIIKEKLPKGVFLREYERIPDTKIESYLGIYIENYSIAEVQKNDGMGLGLYYTCPEYTLGQTIEGVYHLFLFQNNNKIADLIIPPSYSEDSTNVQELCYYNTEQNICRFFEEHQDCSECDSKSNTKLKKAKLINFRDCTGSGKKHDFILVGSTEACGIVNYLVAGYNEELNTIEIYNIEYDNNICQWYSSFYPDEQGIAVIEILCGDHGNEIYTKYTYKFNKSTRIYELVDVIETSCE